MRDVTIGTVFALALIVLALAVMVVGGESGLWFEGVPYQVVFPDATGLLVGAPVRMAGVQIGTVSGIRLPTTPAEQGIAVELDVDPVYAERVRADSRAALRILQLLTNEKYVEVQPGSPAAEALAAGSTIPTLAEVGVVERGEAIAEDLGEVTVALKDILGTLQRGEGLIGQMLKDPEFGKAGLEALGGTLENLEQLTGDMAEGRGVLGRLLYDRALVARLDGLAATIEDLGSVSRALANREGAVGALLEEGGTAEQALADLREAAGSLKRVSAQLEGGTGLVGRLLNDPEYSAAMAEELRGTLADLGEVMRKLNDGEGTLGALINERVLYDGAEEVIAGVNDSKFARWMLRHYQKKGIKAQEDEASKQDAEAPEADPVDAPPPEDP
jgi:phospholipid/cholesterol/gamma-HCH transport system substrate-binding protein